MIPEENHKVKVRPGDKQKLLYEEQETSFHHLADQLLFVTSGPGNISTWTFISYVTE